MEQQDILLSLSQSYNAPYVVYNGVNIRGTGPLCTSGRGTNVYFSGAETDGFVFGTLGDQGRQTGGSLINAHVIKTSGIGGKGVSLLAPSWEMRCGETCLDGLQIHGQNGAAWHTAILIDGSAITVPGASGVRRSVLGGQRGIRTHGAMVGLHAKNAVHLNVSNFQTDPGPTLGGGKMIIDGGQNLVFNNLIINGDFEINGGLNLSIASSFIDTILVSGTARGVTINCTVNNLVIESGAEGVFTGFIHNDKIVNEPTKFKIWSNKA